MNWYLAVLKNYAGFGGRARRKEYWMFYLIQVIVLLALAGVGLAIESDIPYMIYVLATLIPTFAVSFRRLHDTGHSGWWILIGLIPLVGSIILLVFLASEGQFEANKYGENPKLAPAAAA
ncbi:DUF805 domain-containing protein [Streptomyces sp. NPDC049597]|uniref:DUF805 domain-containing protein n=1 Tax=Streptomyces sp. NPDC049597 TaxID=3155276 RepID=UPI003427F857